MTRDGLLSLARAPDCSALFSRAAELRDAGHGHNISYSRKVFIPLTRLCRDVCAYCTFAHPPQKGEFPYLNPDEILEIARQGAAAGCREALFTLGDKPELRYAAARNALASLGHKTTISYLTEMCRLVFEETGLLPHANPGVMTAEELAALRKVTVSQGIMLESISPRLCEKGGPHFGSPDKTPKARLETIGESGRQAIPFTTGILIGIGETWDERIDSLLAIRELHAEYGHIQEIIIQNFRAKPETRMAAADEPGFDDLMRTIAVARTIFGPEMNIQAPPNLSPDAYSGLIAAGINDWGGVSPVTPDHVNPEAPWPEIETLAQNTARAGKRLVERLAIYPTYARQPDKWVDAALRPAVLNMIDAEGCPRENDWSPGITAAIPFPVRDHAPADPAIEAVLAKLDRGLTADHREIVSLFTARGADADRVAGAANALRRAVCGDTVSYVVTRNINYTNICSYGCRFCAFSKGKRSADLGSTPYVLELPEISRRAAEAWDRGATEVCMQGGIHPDFTGETYLRICESVKKAAPEIHIHAFSPLEISQGAATLGLSVPQFLSRLKDAGLGSLPGTAAEILDDDIRAIICPDKISTREWLEIVEAAHETGFRTTATIMFGHMESPADWATHLLAIRDLQERTGGFTEFVPLPFVHMESPLYRRGGARRGPTWREGLLMHAVARLVLYPQIENIQTSWVKMGRDGAAACLNAGANDLGGTLMNESITRAAGTEHGQELDPHEMEELIETIGRYPRMRNTLYRDASRERALRSYDAPPLGDISSAGPAIRHKTAAE